MADKLPLNLAFIALLFVSFLLVSCSSAQYAVMEKFGIHKREILVDRVGEARESQQEAKEQFASALEEFSAVLLSKIPRGRFVEVDEIASMIAWMVSPENSFTTGAVFDLSGGRATY